MNVQINQNADLDNVGITKGVKISSALRKSNNSKPVSPTMRITSTSLQEAQKSLQSDKKMKSSAAVPSRTLSILKDEAAAARAAKFREERFNKDPRMKKLQTELTRIKKIAQGSETLDSQNITAMNYLKEMRYQNNQIDKKTQKLMKEMEDEARFRHLISGSGQEMDAAMYLPSQKDTSPKRTSNRSPVLKSQSPSMLKKRVFGNQLNESTVVTETDQEQNQPIVQFALEDFFVQKVEQRKIEVAAASVTFELNQEQNKKVIYSPSRINEKKALKKRKTTKSYVATMRENAKDLKYRLPMGLELPVKFTRQASPATIRRREIRRRQNRSPYMGDMLQHADEEDSLFVVNTANSSIISYENQGHNSIDASSIQVKVREQKEKQLISKWNSPGVPTDSIERVIGNVSGFTNNTPINSKNVLDKNTARGSQERVNPNQMDLEAIANLRTHFSKNDGTNRQSIDRFFSQNGSPVLRRDSLDVDNVTDKSHFVGRQEHNIKILEENSPQHLRQQNGQNPLDTSTQSAKKHQKKDIIRNFKRDQKTINKLFDEKKTKIQKMKQSHQRVPARTETGLPHNKDLQKSQNEELKNLQKMFSSNYGASTMNSVREESEMGKSKNDPMSIKDIKSEEDFPQIQALLDAQNSTKNLTRRAQTRDTTNRIHEKKGRNAFRNNISTAQEKGGMSNPTSMKGNLDKSHARYESNVRKLPQIEKRLMPQPDTQNIIGKNFGIDTKKGKQSRFPKQMDWILFDNNVLPINSTKKGRENSRSMAFPEGSLKQMSTFSPQHFTNLLTSPMTANRTHNFTDIQQLKQGNIQQSLNECILPNAVKFPAGEKRPFGKIVIV